MMNEKIQDTLQKRVQLYNEIKAKYPDVLLLFRIGNFYKMYEQDAERGSEILGVTLKRTSNGCLISFPYMALDFYLPKLIRAGERVCICDQLETPKKSKAL